MDNTVDGEDSRYLGLVQHACVEDTDAAKAQGKTVVLSFRDSLAAPRAVACPAGGRVYFTKVEVGQGEKVTKASGAG
jgi:hypothetical protein